MEGHLELPGATKSEDPSMENLLQCDINSNQLGKERYGNTQALPSVWNGR
jgi:hypothetical protein